MTHKFGCKLPHSVEEALEIDRQMGTDHWQRALNKEMSKLAMMDTNTMKCCLYMLTMSLQSYMNQRY
jgi:hypothetical protein